MNSNDFKDRLSVQLQHSSIWTELKTLKKIPNDFDVSDPAKRFVLAAMLHLGEIKIAPHQKDFSWVRIIHDKQYGVTPEEFSNIKYGWSYEGEFK